MPRINDPLFLDRFVRRFNLKEQPIGDIDELITPVVDVTSLLTAQPSLLTQRVSMTFAGEANALTPTVGASRHYQVQQPILLRAISLDVVATNVVAPTAAGRDALNAYVFIVRAGLAPPTYNAANQPTNLINRNGTGQPVAAGVNNGTVTNTFDAAEIIGIGIDMVWQPIGAFNRLTARHDLSLLEVALLNGDFLGFHVDVGSTATYPAGTVWDAEWRATLLADIGPGT